MNAVLDGFAQAMTRAGLTAPGTMTPGHVTRFPGAGKSNGNRSGWAWLSPDGQGGAFGDWSSGLSETWHATSDRQMTATERAAQKQRIAELQKIREQETQRGHADAAKVAATIWDAAAPASKSHPYLQKKQIGPHGLRLHHDGRLIVPLYDVSGTLTSLQFIDAAGNKLYLAGGRKQGCLYLIGDITDVLCLAEGYATSASLYEATGYPTVMSFDAGNLLPVALVARGQYPDATIVFCADNDINTDGKPNTGVVAATEAATAIDGRVVIPELDGKKCDWNDIYILRGGDAVKKTIETVIGENTMSTTMSATTVEEAQEVTVDEGWPVLDPIARRGVIGDLVKAIEPHSEADPVAILVQAHIAFGNVIGRSAYFQAEADRHYMNLDAAMVGETAKGRKGVSWGHARRVFAAVDPDWASTRILNGLSSGEGLIWAVRDEITKDEPVREKGRPTGEYQTVVVDRGITDKRLLVLESEFASTLRVMGRDGNTLSAVIRQAWDSGDLRTMTKNSPAQATGAHISIIAHITKDELCRLIEATEASNGFCNRYLWLCVRRSKVLPEGGQFNEAVIAPIVQRLNQAVCFGRKVREITRDEDARAVWRAVYPELSEGKPGLLGAVISRAEAQVMRLACLYALQDMSYVVTPYHLTAALALWEYCEASAKYIFGQRLGDPIADELVTALRKHPKGMTRTEIRDWFGRNRKAHEIDRGLNLLAHQGLSRREDIPSGGRPIERWFPVSRATILTT